ncbi:hypothetical protein Peur_048511 [Populus x canadensis]
MAWVLLTPSDKPATRTDLFDCKNHYPRTVSRVPAKFLSLSPFLPSFPFDGQLLVNSIDGKNIRMSHFSFAQLSTKKSRSGRS